MPVETEIKLRADSSFELPDLSDASNEIDPNPPRTFALDAVYYDTATLALARSRVTLRSRVGEDAPVWTLKLPTEHRGDGALSRGEYTFDGKIGVVPAEAKQAVLALTRGEPLAPVARLHTTRTETVLTRHGTPIAKVVDDLVAGDRDGRSEAFKEIEVELVGDHDPADLGPVVEKLIDRGCQRDDDPLPKALRVLGARALEQPDVAAEPLNKDASLAAFLRAAIATSVRQLVDNHAGTVLGDEDAVHDFRVATRRLRSNLKTFGPLLDPAWARWLGDELAWLGEQVGVERDAGVLAAHLADQVDTLPAEDAPAVEVLFTEVHEHGAEAHRHVVDALQGERYLAVLEALVEASRNPPLASSVADRGDDPARRHVRKLVRKPWRKLRRAADALTPDSADAAYHAARIRAKQARYAAEAVGPLFGRKARRFAEAVEAVQTVLGDHQDAVLAEQWLRQAAVRAPSSALVAGELAAMQRLHRVELRRSFRRAWKRASKPKLRRWLR